MKHNKKKQVTKKGFPIWGWILIAVGVMVVVGLVVFLLPKSTSVTLPPEISVAQAAQKRDQGAFILDVREPSEWAQFHIQGAILIPLGSLANRLNEVPKDRQVVVYCRTGHRSAQGRDILLNAGYKQVTSMTGGITQWQAQGMPIVSGN